MHYMHVYIPFSPYIFVFTDVIRRHSSWCLIHSQVSQVYQTISIPKLLKLASFTDVFQLEKVIVEAAKRNNLQVCLFENKIYVVNLTTFLYKNLIIYTLFPNFWHTYHFFHQVSLLSFSKFHKGN